MQHFKSKILIYVLFVSVFSVFFFQNPENAQAKCAVQSAKFSPSGELAGTWFEDPSRRTVAVEILTSDCVGEEIKIDIVSSIDGRRVIGSNQVEMRSENLVINLKLGGETCELKYNPLNLFRKFDCSLFMIIDDGYSGFRGDAGFITKGKDGGELKYNCGDDCENNLFEWGEIEWKNIPVSSPNDPRFVDTKTTYTPLAPLPGIGTEGCRDLNGNIIPGPDGKQPAPCIDTQKNETDNKCPFGDYINAVIDIIMGLLIVGAVVMIVLGGMEYMMSELISSKEHGKERIRNALLGLVIALGAFILLKTINPALLNVCLDLPQVDIYIDLNADVPQTPIDGKYGEYAVGASWAGIVDAPPMLPTTIAGKTVKIYNTECTTVGQPNCTSTRGLSLTIINKIISGCPTCGEIVITGGTEFWLHGGKTGSTSHNPRSSTVDIRPTTALTRYITGGQPLVIMKRYEKDDVSYLWEGDHWHAGP